MTESDWWAAADPCALIDWLFFDAHGSDRKLRLFSVAGCQPLREIVQSPQILAALDAAEVFADGGITADQLSAIHIAGWNHFRARHYDSSRRPTEPVRNAETVALYPTGQEADRDRSRYEREEDAPYATCLAMFIDHPDKTYPSFPHLVRLLHDIFGPLPFRDIVIPPSWLTSDVVLLARGIYDDKAFDRMPILADALQDAGCDNDEVLNHCRDATATHVRGCWVIDLLLGRPWREP